MSWILFLLHGAQVGLSGHAGYHSYIAVTNLQQYESATQRAAKFLSVADDQLQRTRKTHTAGAVSIMASFASALYLLLQPSMTPQRQIVLAVVNAGATTGARAYMMDFWSKKRTVPVVKGYNEGIEHSNRLGNLLQYLAVTWVLSSIITLAI